MIWVEVVVSAIWGVLVAQVWLALLRRSIRTPASDRGVRWHAGLRVLAVAIAIALPVHASPRAFLVTLFSFIVMSHRALAARAIERPWSVGPAAKRGILGMGRSR